MFNIINHSGLRILNEKGYPITEFFQVTKDNQKKIKVPCKQEISCSDCLSVPLKIGEIIEIRTYLNQETILTSGLVSYSRLQQEILNYDYKTGKNNNNFIDQKSCFRMVKENSRMFFIYGLAGVLGYASENKTIVAFGDSLTQQGFWIDHLKNRLIKENYNNISVINKGIGGGRILNDTDPNVDSFQRHGRSGVKRFLNNVFEPLRTDGIIVFHGINDVLGVENSKEIPCLYEKIIAALIFYEEEAHLRGVPIFIATLLPLNQNSGMFSENGEKLRKMVNQWILSNNKYNGVFNFSKAVEDPQKRNNLKRIFDCGDGLHLSSEGGKAVAQSIDLDLIIETINRKEY